MDKAGEVLALAHELYARADETTSAANATSSSTSDATTTEKPAVYKIIGISLAISSGAFIGTSFVLKKFGLLKANEKYNEVAGEGYGYLKNMYWWAGMTLMIIGEICNFVAYAFTDAILVTPLGALSVVLTTILSAIFLKERLSMVGKVACFLCIVGSVVIVMNAPEEASVATIQEMQHFVIQPGFLSYAGVILLGSAATAFWAGPRWGKKNMLVYISICSWVGGLSVVATQGLGSAIVAAASGTKNQFNQWFFYILLVFVICTLLTEIIFLNKALNLFNAAMVTPTYYVYFTSTTIVTSAVLFQGFKGTASSIVTVVNGFLTICSGVVLLQLSKSAKDVPDTAVFSGDLDQIQTIAEQEQSETEPKADAIRGTAAIVRRISAARQNWEIAELKRMHEEKMRERMELETVSEHGGNIEQHEPSTPMYEWDGIRRRRTTVGSQRSRSQTVSSRPFTPGAPPTHPPLGWSHMPTDEELAALDRPTTPGMLSSIAGTIRGRGRSRGTSVLLPSHNNDIDDPSSLHPHTHTKLQSPMHPVQLTEISMPANASSNANTYYDNDARYGLPSNTKTEYTGASGYASSDAASVLTEPPHPPPHLAKRQFSFQNVFKRHQQNATPEPEHVYREEEEDEQFSVPHAHMISHTNTGRPPSRPPVSASRGYSTPQVKGSTEEERLGLVKGDSRSLPALPVFDEEEEEEDDGYGKQRNSAHRAYNEIMRMDQRQEKQEQKYGRGITAPGGTSPRNTSPSRGREKSGSVGSQDQGRSRQAKHRQDTTPPPPPPGGRRYSPPRGGNGGAFI
ncbi:non-imprinted in prader-willi angelman syndrome region protein 2 [Ophiostoma piceae UAMH 11346]|uniref:Non-imprinted in prader-willi angelman syndrome region protein 2 n=1 Tax=Ophiostoma piceae (strain UAMH 11346) TaxID=1262450 RepID=S3CZT8_OPHP1|nr:non-imprinted in prader-willi angelman syndrome region protein 2 [Ophiostoma piceae UAMH 11346]